MNWKEQAGSQDGIAPGWYRGEVQKYNEDDNMLYILYFKIVLFLA